jgi:hypothetical protein
MARSSDAEKLVSLPQNQSYLGTKPEVPYALFKVYFTPRYEKRVVASEPMIMLVTRAVQQKRGQGIYKFKGIVCNSSMRKRNQVNPPQLQRMNR